MNPPALPRTGEGRAEGRGEGLRSAGPGARGRAAIFASVEHAAADDALGEVAAPKLAGDGLPRLGGAGFLVFIFGSFLAREKRWGPAAPAVASQPKAASSAAADWRDTPVLSAAGGS